MRLAVALSPLLLLLATPASAVIIVTGDGTGNKTPPPDDPGLVHVGTRTSGGLSVVYLGNRWVLTADHVGESDVILNGGYYDRVPGSEVQLSNTSGLPPDLAVFRIQGNPGLPILPIRATSPGMNNDVILIGYGKNRGDATIWSGHDGWLWQTTTSRRWGTNRVSGFATIVDDPDTSTLAFYTNFTENGGTSDESQAASGDSGGAGFIKNGSTWELAGIMFTIGQYPGQPLGTALYGNLTYLADLSEYRDQIISLTRPECSDEVDNDGDTLIDYPDDPQCSSMADPLESLNPSTDVPSLSGGGLALLAGSLAGMGLAAARVRAAP